MSTYLIGPADGPDEVIDAQEYYRAIQALENCNEVSNVLLEYFLNEDPEGLKGEEARLYTKAANILIKHGLIEKGESDE